MVAESITQDVLVFVHTDSHSLQQILHMQTVHVHAVCGKRRMKTIKSQRSEASLLSSIQLWLTVLCPTVSEHSLFSGNEIVGGDTKNDFLLVKG